MTKDHPFRRRGSMYAAAIGAAMVVSVLGMSALMAVRIERKSADATGDLDAARFYAQSAVETGVWIMSQDPNWRTNQVSGAWKVMQPIGSGLYSLDGVDPIDGDLANSKTEPILLTGTGLAGDAQFIFRATAVAEPKPLDALSRALTCNGDFSTLVGITFLSTTASIHTNAQLNNIATINANVEVGSVRALGIVLGTVTNPAPALAMPEAGVFAMYQSIATTIPYPGSVMDRQVLTPGVNPWGVTNPDGVYYIDTGLNDLTITRSRVLGTLVIKCGAGRSLILDDPVLLQNYRPDYPVLIADCDVEIKLASSNLREGPLSTNFNPAGAAYLGVTDADQLDSYPNEVQGLVHVRKSLKLSTSTTVHGSVICEGAVTANGAVIVYTPSLLTRPPMGYTSYDMVISPGSWERVVLP